MVKLKNLIDHFLNGVSFPTELKIPKINKKRKNSDNQ